MPEQQQETLVLVDRQPPETAQAGSGPGPAEGSDWEAYSLDVLTDLLDS